MIPAARAAQGDASVAITVARPATVTIDGNWLRQEASRLPDNQAGSRLLRKPPCLKPERAGPPGVIHCSCSAWRSWLALSAIVRRSSAGRRPRKNVLPRPGCEGGRDRPVLWSGDRRPPSCPFWPDCTSRTPGPDWAERRSRPGAGDDVLYVKAIAADLLRSATVFAAKTGALFHPSAQVRGGQPSAASCQATSLKASRGAGAAPPVDVHCAAGSLRLRAPTPAVLPSRRRRAFPHCSWP